MLLDPLMIRFDPSPAALGRLSSTDPHSSEQPKVVAPTSTGTYLCVLQTGCGEPLCCPCRGDKPG